MKIKNIFKNTKTNKNEETVTITVNDMKSFRECLMMANSTIRLGKLSAYDEDLSNECYDSAREIIESVTDTMATIINE